MSLLSHIKTISVILVAAVAMSTSVVMASQKDGVFDPFTASIEVNIRMPEVGKKHKAAVSEAMAKLEQVLKETGLAVSRVRDGEVVLVTIPCDRLFAPNSPSLRGDADKNLLPLLPYIKRSDNFKVVVAVHSDDTGDSQYTDQLTADRASAIDEFYSRHTSASETGIIPYGIGTDEPVAPNSGIRNRAANRRVEVYFIPTATFISKAKK